MAELADLPAGRQARRLNQDNLYVDMVCMGEWWYVYILKDENNRFYKGLTNNLERRLKQHIIGQNKTTKKMSKISLVHVEICKTRLEARKLEKFF